MFKEDEVIIASFKELREIYNLIRKLQLKRVKKKSLHIVEQNIVVYVSTISKNEDFVLRLEDFPVLKELDEELKLVAGYIARKHLLIEKVKRIKKYLKRFEE